MTRSYVHQYYDLRRTKGFDHDSGIKKGRVYRKRFRSLAKDHRGVNNTKYQHHMLMSAMDDPHGNHSFYIYGYDLSQWLN